MVDKAILDAFRALYRGRQDVWGSVEGRSNKEPVTEANYEQHLDGKKSMGLYPLLDDGTCYFFAVDLDEKDFAKAKSIREEFGKVGLPVYISMSKGKGYHIYGFAETKFVAKDVRQIAHRILLKLGISCEVFPKQDRLDETIKYGNYINLPCFGTARYFLNASHEEVPLAKAVQRIARIPEAALPIALQALPETQPSLQPSNPGAPKATVKKKTKHPPCVDGLLKGVGQGARDEAAFALARHYLDQGYLPEEVMALMLEWDKKNQPPINDMHLMETKIRSAQKGYAFGCASITSGLLSNFCVGEANCEWLKSTTKDKKKKGLIRELSFYEDEQFMYEEIIEANQPLYLQYNKQSGEIKKCSEIQVGEVSIMPLYSAEIIEEAVLLPSGVEEYGDTPALVERIKKHITRYCDLPSFFLEFAAWYVMMSWIYDKLRTVSYLRFVGDTGTGKSRALDTMGTLCYKPMVLSGAVTPAPIYRLIKKFRGTLVLDEADFRDSSEKSEVVTILNCGFERGRPVIRCLKDDPDQLQVLPCFGPKVFASRYSFQDVALEARCLSHTMEETDRDDIPPVLGESFKQATLSLRNQLLLWRFRTQPKIDPRASDDIDLGPIEPRLKQTSLPYAIPFKDLPETLDRFKTFILAYNQELVRERNESAQGRVVYAFLSCTESMGKGLVTAAAVAEKCKSMNLDISATTVGKILKSLNLKTDKKRAVGKQQRFIQWEERLMRKIRRRYITDRTEFVQLFEGMNLDTPAPDEEEA